LSAGRGLSYTLGASLTPWLNRTKLIAKIPYTGGNWGARAAANLKQHWEKERDYELTVNLELNRWKLDKGRSKHKEALGKGKGQLRNSKLKTKSLEVG
jgi:hypothetical protein